MDFSVTPDSDAQPHFGFGAGPDPLLVPGTQYAVYVAVSQTKETFPAPPGGSSARAYGEDGNVEGQGDGQLRVDFTYKEVHAKPGLWCRVGVFPQGTTPTDAVKTDPIGGYVIFQIPQPN